MCARFGWYNRNAAINPYLVEGKKTGGMELAEQLVDAPPQWVAASVGDGCSIAGIYKGIASMKAIGVTNWSARMLGVQAAGCDPVARAFESGRLDRSGQGDTYADSINVAIPRNWRKAVNAVRESGGGIRRGDRRADHASRGADGPAQRRFRRAGGGGGRRGNRGGQTAPNHRSRCRCGRVRHRKRIEGCGRCAQGRRPAARCRAVVGRRGSDCGAGIMAIVLTNAILVDIDPIRVEPGGLRLGGNSIVVRGPVTPAAGDETIDCGGAVVLPGLVNGHTHLYSALAVGMPSPPRTPKNFHEILQLVWWRLDQALDTGSIETSAVIGALDALRCGTTTLIDHHASPNAIDGSLDLIQRGVAAAGMRGVLCYETTDRHGPAGRQAGLEENERYLRRCAEKRDGRFAGLVGAARFIHS